MDEQKLLPKIKTESLTTMVDIKRTWRLIEVGTSRV
jgi:hypothetical protein